MQEFFEKKKTAQPQLEDEKKKQPAVCHPISVSMTEGPMLLKEERKLEDSARDSFEKSVKIELAALQGKLQKKKEKKKQEKRGKRVTIDKGKKRKPDPEPPRK